jgi:hypothetical protein
MRAIKRIQSCLGYGTIATSVEESLQRKGVSPAASLLLVRRLPSSV